MKFHQHEVVNGIKSTRGHELLQTSKKQCNRVPQSADNEDADIK